MPTGAHLKTHGMTGTPTYRSWHSMWSRVLWPRNTHYNEVTVAVDWLKFENFYADMGERLVGMTLDRIDNRLGYSKANCRWATYSEQNRNRRPYKHKDTKK